MSASRWVLHFDMDAFFASVEQLTRPTLRGRPVLVGGAGGRGVVAGASYESRVYGARSAMPMHQARRLVGASAVVLPPRGVVYGAASRRVFGAVRELVPVLETLSFDEAFGEPAELVGAPKDRVLEFASELRSRILAATGLVASVGAGPGKQTAKIASGLCKPDGMLAIAADEQQAVLAPLSVRKIWGIGPVAGDRLAKLGVETIGQFAAMSEVEVVSVLGATVGPALLALARGTDDRPVTARAEAKSISAEHTFPVDLVTLDALRREIERSCDDALRRLERDGRGARTVVLKLKRADMSLLTRSATLPQATAERSALLATAQRLALDPVEIGAIRLVGVGFSGLSEVAQFALFPEFGGHPGGDGDGGDSGGDPGDAADPAPGAGTAGPGVTDAGDAVDTEDVGERSGATIAWATGMDVRHPEFGHGWVQGAGHGVLSVRFETRATGPGRMRSFRADDPDLRPGDPLDSLAWEPSELDDPDQ